jgi:predicted dienelactone hydrolase
MRLLEVLLSLANLLAFFSLAFRLPRAVRWMRLSAPAALPVAGVQALLEGTRWQMIPAYGLAGLFFFAWLLAKAAPSGNLSSRLARGLVAGLGIVGLPVSIALPLLAPVFRFPPPGGPYRIGTLTYHWVDTSRPEIFSEPSARRELMVQIWYPTRGETSSARAPYVQDVGALAPGLARLAHLPGFAFGHLRHVTTNAIPSAPVADEEPNYPVLLFLEGLGGFRQMNTFQVEELVSHGYIVAAIDQPYAAAAVVFPDGRQAAGLPVDQSKPLVLQSYLPSETAPTLHGRAFPEGIIPYLAQDVIFTLDRLAELNREDPHGILTGWLDLERAGTFGVSLGGIVAAESCRLAPQLRACLFMDAPMPVGVVRDGLRQPTMIITRDAETMRLERERAGGWPEYEIEIHQTSMRAVYDSLPGDGYFLRVPGIFHIDFTDVPSWSPIAGRLGFSGLLPAERSHAILNAYTLTFFERHLKGRPAPLLDGPSAQYPEVLFERRQNQ